MTGGFESSVKEIYLFAKTAVSSIFKIIAIEFGKSVVALKFYQWFGVANIIYGINEAHSRLLVHSLGTASLNTHQVI